MTIVLSGATRPFHPIALAAYSAFPLLAQSEPGTYVTSAGSRSSTWTAPATVELLCKRTV